MGDDARPTVAEPGDTRWDERAAGPWRVGDVILDTYEVLRVFAAGGMGLVYQVRHRGWGLDMAVKRPRPEFFRTDDQRADFEREAETWAGLGLHPHVVTCHYVRRIDAVPCVFAEYAPGGSLADRLRDGPLPIAAALDAGIQAAWGLDHAHARGLVHQDVKPANLLVTEWTPGPTVKVSDFGLAGARAAVVSGSDMRPGQTVAVSGAGIFTPEYAAPEQFAGEHLTRRADVWAWAVTLLEMLTGRRPAVGPAAPDLLAVVDRGGWPAGLFDLLQSCLATDPADRPRDMKSVEHRLRDSYRKLTGDEYPRRAPRAARLDLDAKNNRGVSLADLGKPAEAEELWAEVLRAERDHPEAGYNLALARWRAGQETFEEVIADAQEVAASYPDDPRPPVLVARIHLESGDSNAAMTALGSTAIGADADLTREAIRGQLSQMPRRVWASNHPGEELLVAWAGERYVVTRARDRVLRIWDAITGDLVRTLTGHRGPPQGLVASADGRLLLSGTFAEHVGDPAELALWDLTTGHLLWKQTRRSAGGPVVGSFIPLAVDDGTAIAFAEGKLQVWADGRCVADIETGGNEAAAGGIVVTLGGTGGEARLRVWTPPNPTPVNEFPIARVPSDLAVTPDGRFATGRLKGVLRSYNLVTGAESAGPPPGATGFTATIGGPVEYSHHLVTVRQAATDRPVAVFAPHVKEGTQAIAVGPGGRLATIGGDGVAVWDLDPAADPFVAPPAVCVARRSEAVVAAEEACDAALAAAREAMTRRDWQAAADHVRTARRQPGSDRRADALAVWAELGSHLGGGRFRRGWWADTVTTPSVRSLAVTRDGRKLLVAEHLGFQFWDGTAGRPFGAVEASMSRQVALTPDGDIAFTATGVVGRPLRLVAWDVTAERSLWEATLPPLTVGISEMRVSGDGRTLFTVQGDQSVRRWDVATGELLATHVGRLGGAARLAPSADGSWFAIVDDHGAARVLDSATGRCRRTLVRMQARSVAVAGRLVLVGRTPDDDAPGSSARPLPADEVLTLWDAGTGNRVRSLTGSLAGAECVALSADGSLAVAGFKDSMSVWDADTGEFLRTFPGHRDKVEFVAAGDDRRRVVSAAGDNVRLWDLDWELTDQPPVRRPAPPPITWDDTFEPYQLAVQDPTVDESRPPAVFEPVALGVSKLVLNEDGLYRGRLGRPQTLVHPLSEITNVTLRWDRSGIAIGWIVLFLLAAAVGPYWLTGWWAWVAGLGGFALGLAGLFGLYIGKLVVTTDDGTTEYELTDMAEDSTAFAASIHLAARATRCPD